MIKIRKLPKKKGEHKSNQPLPTTPGKADFTPIVTDETVEGECTGIIGVSRPPKKTRGRG
jgi:hypothetical protein